MKENRVLGVDPGISRTGWGVVDRDGGKLLCIANGVIRPRTKSGLAARLRSISEGLQRVITLHQPTCAAVEDIFHHRNPRSAFVLGQARGAALVALAQSDIEPASYAPAMVKRVVTGSGSADKLQVSRAIRAILQLGPSPHSPDALDALAIAICHVLAGRAQQMLRQST